ncbi:MAG TPA: hypothetical protein VJP86_05510 [Vicinamibacterales bacterium]|jgi:hypothetical protein|nr:hypothetical protein [Vicinamibacterales bacterium]
MKLVRSVLMIGILVAPGAAYANDFGIFHTAVPVEKSVWRLGGGGWISLEDNGREAFVASADTGLGAKADAEIKLAISGDDKAFGGAVNYLLVNASDSMPVDVSVLGGFHYVNHDVNDVTSVDIAAIASKQIKPKLAVYGALDLAFQSFDLADGVEDDNETAWNLVPGVVYTVSPKVDVAVELGIGISDTATTYLAGMVHYYIR